MFLSETSGVFASYLLLNELNFTIILASHKYNVLLIIAMRMKKILFLLPILFVSICSMTSCREAIDDFIEDRLKIRYTDYLHNETDQDVTVFFRPGMPSTSANTYLVRKGETVEIPDSIRLYVVSLRYHESDSIAFVFADGTRVVHTYTNTSYGQETYHFVYAPAENNIYYTGYDVPTEQDSWKQTIISTWKIRMDYYIK